MPRRENNEVYQEGPMGRGDVRDEERDGLRGKAASRKQPLRGPTDRAVGSSEHTE
jgi:hypothetical protein